MAQVSAQATVRDARRLGRAFANGLGLRDCGETTDSGLHGDAAASTPMRAAERRRGDGEARRHRRGRAQGEVLRQMTDRRPPGWLRLTAAEPTSEQAVRDARLPI
jgi:hypothetical protein